MKRIIFFVVLCSAAYLFESCGTQRLVPSEEKMQEIDMLLKISQAQRKYTEAFEFIALDAKSDKVNLCFKFGESPYYEPYTLTNRFVYVDFFDDDCSEDGRVNDHKWSIRTFHISVPDGEVVKKIDYKGITTVREDGSEHYIKFVLVNRPVVN